MSRTYTLRRQHRALEELVQHITRTMVRIDTHDDAMECGRSLGKLTGVLTFHLAAEDQSLYPRMQASSDQNVAKTAAAFAQEMGGLSEVYSEFAAKWSTGNAIFEDPDGFRTEAQLVFSALARRIERENEELYPLADAMVSVGQIDSLNRKSEARDFR